MIPSDEITALKAECETLRRALQKCQEYAGVFKDQRDALLTEQPDPARLAHGWAQDDPFVIKFDSSPHTCPVCKGKGRMPSGFFGAVGVDTWSSGIAEPDICQPCKGTGLVWG